MAPFLISQCYLADGPALAANSIPAFWADPHWVLAWRHRTLKYHKAVDLKTGRILGYARWCLPPPTEISADDDTLVWAEKEAEIRRIAETVVWDPNNDADELEDQVTALKKELIPKTPHISLEYLAVHPDNQRKGVRTALVKSGMDQADKLGLNIFVHAFKAGVELYKRMGFRLLVELVQDDSAYGGSGEYGAYFFIYEPGSRTDCS
ncbi:Acyl-CoA N-acyltransferase [Penicillium lividum]|nr:Acyl-CoA N-acyltransferase [Penicillium lividum]